MADNYQQATVVPFLRVPEGILRLLDALYSLEDGPLTPGILDAIPQDWAEDDENGGHRLTEDMANAVRAVGHEPAQGREGETSFFFEDWTPDSAADLLQWLLKHDPDTPYVTIEGAYTCSKLRPGEFGGFAWFITEDSYDCSGTQLWIHEKEQEFKAAQEAAKSVS